MPDNGLTEQQRKWMASLRASLEAKTGRAMSEWVETARACPETAPRARQRWFKETHGLGQNYATILLEELAAEAGANPRDPAALRDALWSDPRQAAIFEKLQAAIDALSQAVTGQRKAYTSWSRAYAFAASRPLHGKGVRLGLAVEPDADSRLEAPRNEGWSERLIAALTLMSVEQVDDGLKTLLRAAWERS